MRAMYQELQPIGGVSASVFPTTIRKTRVAFPCELLALLYVNGIRAAVGARPGMMPVVASTVSPGGRPLAENRRGRVPYGWDSVKRWVVRMNSIDARSIDSRRRNGC